MQNDDWRSWAEQMATGLGLVDADLRVLWLTPVLAELLDIGPRSAVGQPLGGLLREPKLLAHAEQVLSGRAPCSCVVSGQRSVVAMPSSAWKAVIM